MALLRDEKGKNASVSFSNRANLVPLFGAEGNVRIGGAHALLLRTLIREVEGRNGKEISLPRVSYISHLAMPKSKVVWQRHGKLVVAQRHSPFYSCFFACPGQEKRLPRIMGRDHKGETIEVNMSDVGEYALEVLKAGEMWGALSYSRNSGAIRIKLEPIAINADFGNSEGSRRMLVVRDEGYRVEYNNGMLKLSIEDAKSWLCEQIVEYPPEGRGMPPKVGFALPNGTFVPIVEYAYGKPEQRGFGMLKIAVNDDLNPYVSVSDARRGEQGKAQILLVEMKS